MDGLSSEAPAPSSNSETNFGESPAGQLPTTEPQVAAPVETAPIDPGAPMTESTPAPVEAPTPLASDSFSAPVPEVPMTPGMAPEGTTPQPGQLPMPPQSEMPPKQPHKAIAIMLMILVIAGALFAGWWLYIR